MDDYEGWAIVEIMGHRRLGGYVSPVEMYGRKMMRLDIYGKENPEAYMTQFYNGDSIYCLTPASEESARVAGELMVPEPIKTWELPQLPESTEHFEEGWQDG